VTSGSKSDAVVITFFEKNHYVAETFDLTALDPAPSWTRLHQAAGRSRLKVTGGISEFWRGDKRERGIKRQKSRVIFSWSPLNVYVVGSNTEFAFFTAWHFWSKYSKECLYG
jgi:hypothetical protein